MESKKSAKPTFTGPIPVGASKGQNSRCESSGGFCASAAWKAKNPQNQHSPVRFRSAPPKDKTPAAKAAGVFAHPRYGKQKICKTNIYRSDSGRRLQRTKLPLRKQRGFLRIRGVESKKSAKPTFTGPIPVGASKVKTPAAKAAGVFAHPWRGKTGRRVHTDPPPCFCQPGKAVPTISTRRGRTASTISRPFSAEEERAVARTPVEGMASLSMGYLK